MKCQQILLFLAVGLCGSEVFAAAAGGGGLAWEAPLLTITNSFTGPVALAVSTIAVVLSLSTLAFADNLSGAGRQLVYLVLVIAALIGVVSLLQTLFQGGASTDAPQVSLLLVGSALLLASGIALARLQVAVFDALRRLHARHRSENARLID